MSPFLLLLEPTRRSMFNPQLSARRCLMACPLTEADSISASLGAWLYLPSEYVQVAYRLLQHCFPGSVGRRSWVGLGAKRACSTRSMTCSSTLTGCAASQRSRRQVGCRGGAIAWPPASLTTLGLVVHLQGGSRDCHHSGTKHSKQSVDAALYSRISTAWARCRNANLVLLVLGIRALSMTL